VSPGCVISSQSLDRAFKNRSPQLTALVAALTVSVAVWLGSAGEACAQTVDVYDSASGIASVVPNWMADGSSFWYVNGSANNTVVYKVDPKTGRKEPLFDVPRLLREVAAALGHEAGLCRCAVSHVRARGP